MAQDLGVIGASDTGGEVFTLWFTKQQSIEKLGVSTRTLLRMVSRGEVERRQVGRKARYRLVDKEPEGTDWNTEPASDTPGNPELVRLVEQLTERIATLERERAEATAVTQREREALNQAFEISHQIADERDQFLEERDLMLAARDEALEQQERALAEREQALTARAEALAERDEALDAWDIALTDARLTVFDRDQALYARDEALKMVAASHIALVRSNNNVRQLHTLIEAQTNAISEVCASPLSLPIRRRLRAILATC